MSADSDRRGITELRQMDRETARNTLTVTEYERWEKLQDLHEQADETREQWAEEEDTVAEITVHADMEQLGTELDLYGNDVLVHVDSQNTALEDHADAVDDILGDVDPEDVDSLTQSDLDDVLGHLLDMLDIALVRWNGTEWADLPEDARADTLARIGESWGVEAVLMAWFDIAEAMHEEREEKVSAIESFRDPQRRGRR